MFVGIDFAPLPNRALNTAAADAMELLGFNDFEYVVVGNREVPYLNDLDIAIGRNQLASHLKLARGGCFWTALDAYLESRNIGEYVIRDKFRQFHFATPFFRMHASPAFVKTDVFIGEIGWMKALTSGAPKESRYKAIYRNLLLMSVFLELKWPAENGVGNEYFRYALNFRDGLRRRRFRQVHPSRQDGIPKRVTIHEEFITSDPNDIPRILFDGKSEWTDIDSFEKLYLLLGGDSFRYSSFLPAICQNFLMSLHKGKMRLPEKDIEWLSSGGQRSGYA
ncbi:hypothetical protein [Marilutibacter chinensis]|uniref:Uncharacterized protein n=1 Tax=Marilutibacter chinensis TaxID=2912247 RepID=A0ABS9HY76_9GAMM|nr:hypothetical protein [Lysobacter chinensis]MCF7223753.1 hypothetical protein [Lysobacter chinensis]